MPSGPVEHDLPADRDDGVEHRTFAVGERPRHDECVRARERATATNETCAIGFERQLGRFCPGHRHQVHEPAGSLVLAARATRAQHGALRPYDLGLHEQLAECRVQGVCDGGRQCDLYIARDLDRARFAGVVDQPDPAQFDVVFGRDRDLGARLDQLPVDAVAAVKLGAPLGENGFVRFRLASRRLRRVRPERAGLDVAQVAEAPPVIARRVFLPARQRDVLPAAVATPAAVTSR